MARLPGARGAWAHGTHTGPYPVVSRRRPAPSWTGSTGVHCSRSSPQRSAQPPARRRSRTASRPHHHDQRTRKQTHVRTRPREGTR
jgi:hypothetical protein